MSQLEGISNDIKVMWFRNGSITCVADDIVVTRLSFYIGDWFGGYCFGW